jgi:hypothetical protein
MKLSSVIILATTLAPGAAAAAEYHIYKNTSGSIVLSNLPAGDRPADRTPESLASVKSYT